MSDDLWRPAPWVSDAERERQRMIRRLIGGVHGLREEELQCLEPHDLSYIDVLSRNRQMVVLQNFVDFVRENLRRDKRPPNDK